MDLDKIAFSWNTNHYFNNSFHEFKVLKKIIRAETFNVSFHNKFIKFWIILFFLLFFILLDLISLFYIYIYIYIYIYMCVCVCVCVCVYLLQKVYKILNKTQNLQI